MRSVWMISVLIGLFGIHSLPAFGASGSRIDFNREIRPLLVEHCYPCHGPDLEKRKGGLRLDRPEGATLKLSSGARAVVPGNPSASRLLQVISSTDPDEHMPPASTGKQLSPS
ncbi:MAG: c-type cytochrome domain-containing protein, partial [Limisphaerales bacterium]